jgi:hypothetical protein
MLAETSFTVPASGSLGRNVHLPATSLHAVIAFIGDELPRWRDRPERNAETSETALTSQLCAHLNSAARHSAGWDVLQFRIEEPDERKKGRRIDMVPAPCDATIWIEGRRYVDFEALLPIECKRLPTPKGPDRDECEYVHSKYSSTGGIQRFKDGLHGGAHELGAMIGYVQEETAEVWHGRVAEWINELVKAGQSGWSAADSLQIERDDKTSGLAVLHSTHDRGNRLAKINLVHLWITMG